MLLAIWIFMMGLQDAPPREMPASTALMAFTGEHAGDRFGEVLAAVGDVDGDGWSDFAVGAHCRRGRAGAMAGAVDLRSGVHGGLLHHFEGEGPFHRFGRSIAYASFFGSEHIDPVIGAPYFGIPGLPECGRVYIFSGGDGRLIRTFDGEKESDWFGFALGCMDINGDGFEDLLVGAPGFDGGEDPNRQEDRGCVCIHSGADGTLLRRLEGFSPGDWFGYTICCIDVDADGFGDALIGAPGRDGPSLRNTGAVHACSGADGRMLYTVSPPGGTERFGVRLGPLSDLTGDGIQEFMACGFAEEGARTHVLDGSNGAILFTFESEGEDDGRPRPLLAVGDQDGDGTPDLIMGGSGPSSSCLRLLSGRDGRPLHRLPCGEKLFGLGHSLAGPLEAELTGYPRLLAGANPYLNRGGEEPGMAILFNLSPQGLLSRIGHPLAGPKVSYRLALLEEANGNGRFRILAGSPRSAGAAGQESGRISVMAGLGGKPSLDIEGEAAGGRFGESVCNAGDIDGDGRSDFLVGAPGFPLGKDADAGRVYLYSSAEGRLLDARFTGKRGGDSLGASLAVLDDATGDGFQDFLLGAPGFVENEKENAGVVLLVNGRTLKIVRRFPGLMKGGRLGTSLTPVGDLDGDGLEDFLAGSLFYSKENGAVLERILAYSPKSEFPLFVLPAPSAGERFGAAAVGIHDADQDGIPDLLVGAPGYSGSLGPAQGRIYLFSGKSGRILGGITGQSAGGRLGRSMALLRDLDGDGLHEIAVGVEAGRKGRICFLSSRDLSAIGWMESPEDTLNFGYALAVPRSPRHKGNPALLIAASRRGEEGPATEGLLFAYGADLPVRPLGKEEARLRIGPVRPWVIEKEPAETGKTEAPRWKEPLFASVDPRLLSIRITTEVLPLNRAAGRVIHPYLALNELDRSVLVWPGGMNDLPSLLEMFQKAWQVYARLAPSASGLWIRLLPAGRKPEEEISFECLP